MELLLCSDGILLKVYENRTVATCELNKHDHDNRVSCLMFLKGTKMVFYVDYFAHFIGVLLVLPPVYLEYCYMHVR